MSQFSEGLIKSLLLCTLAAKGGVSPSAAMEDYRENKGNLPWWSGCFSFMGDSEAAKNETRSATSSEDEQGYGPSLKSLSNHKREPRRISPSDVDDNESANPFSGSTRDGWDRPMCDMIPIKIGKVPEYFIGIATASVKLGTSVHYGAPDKNSISCALGPVQILEALYQTVLNQSVKDEIKDFVGHDLSATGLKDFLAIIRRQSSFGGTFLNNFYVFPASKGIRQEPLNTLSNLGASIKPLDFIQSSQSATEINRIVSTDTHNIFKGVVEASDFSADTRIVFLSTLYVKVKWINRFVDTQLDFKTPSKTIKINGFNGMGRMLYREDFTHSFLTIPAENDLNFMIKMPKFLGRLVPITVEDLVECSNNEKINLTMPNFTLENTLDLRKYLRQSLPTLLNSSFSTTLTDELLKVSKFLQKNKIEINKVGVEADSVTVMGFEKKCATIEPEPRKVVVDSPFSWALYQQKNRDKLVLLSGIEMDPTQG